MSTYHHIEENTRPHLTMPEFIAEVKRRIEPMDKMSRFEGEQGRLDALIRDACRQIQEIIPWYQYRHQDIITSTQAPAFCEANKGRLPAGEIERLFVSILDEELDDPFEPDPDPGVDFCDEGRRLVPVYRIPWRYWKILARGDLDSCWSWVEKEVRNELRRPCKPFFIAIDPAGQFYLGPKLKEGEWLEVEWTGLKSIYNESDKLNWGEELADAAGLYVSAFQELGKRAKQNMYSSYWAQFQRSVSLASVALPVYGQPVSRYPNYGG